MLAKHFARHVERPFGMGDKCGRWCGEIGGNHPLSSEALKIASSTLSEVEVVSTLLRYPIE